MKDDIVIEKAITYIGSKELNSPDAISFEIEGLKIVMLRAQEKIALLEQSKYLAKIKIAEMKKWLNYQKEIIG